MAKYLKEFTEHADYTAYIEGNPYLPNVSVCVNENHVHFNPAGSDVPPDNEIWYTTVSGDAIYVATGDLEGTYVGPVLVSNVAPKDNNGKGVITFAEPITKLGYIDTGFTEYYPIIGPLDFDKCLTSFIFPKCLYYLGYYSLPYCTEMEEITIPDTVTELWELPNYGEYGDVACPFTMSRKYEEGTVIGGLKKIKTSKGEDTWGGDIMNVTLANGNEYKVIDFITL